VRSKASNDGIPEVDDDIYHDMVIIKAITV